MDISQKTLDVFLKISIGFIFIQLYDRIQGRKTQGYNVFSLSSSLSAMTCAQVFLFISPQGFLGPTNESQRIQGSPCHMEATSYVFHQFFIPFHSSIPNLLINMQFSHPRADFTKQTEILFLIFLSSTPSKERVLWKTETVL